MALNEMLIVEVMKILEYMEFELYTSDWFEDENEYWDDFRWQKVLMLKDIQWGNLWNIENAQFKNLSEVLSRMDVYINDYFYNDLDEYFDIRFDWYDDLMKIENDECDYELFVCKFYLSEKIYKMLEQITPEMVEELQNKLKEDWDTYWVKQDYNYLKMFL